MKFNRLNDGRIDRAKSFLLLFIKIITNVQSLQIFLLYYTTNVKKAIALYPPLLLFHQLKLCTVERIGSNITSVFKAIALYNLCFASALIANSSYAYRRSSLLSTDCQTKRI